MFFLINLVLFINYIHQGNELKRRQIKNVTLFLNHSVLLLKNFIFFYFSVYESVNQFENNLWGHPMQNKPKSGKVHVDNFRFLRSFNHLI